MFCNPLLNSESNLLAYFQSSVFKYDFTYILSLYAIVGLILGGSYGSHICELGNFRNIEKSTKVAVIPLPINRHY